MSEDKGYTPSPQPHGVGSEPIAWLIKIYDNSGLLLDTRLDFVKPTIMSTAKTETIPLFSGAPPKDSVGPLFIRVADFFDADATAASFMNEDGDGGFIGAIYRMAREIERLRVASAEVEG